MNEPNMTWRGVRGNTPISKRYRIDYDIKKTRWHRAVIDRTIEVLGHTPEETEYMIKQILNFHNKKDLVVEREAVCHLFIPFGAGEKLEYINPNIKNTRSQLGANKGMLLTFDNPSFYFYQEKWDEICMIYYAAEKDSVWENENFGDYVLRIRR